MNSLTPKAQAVLDAYDNAPFVDFDNAHRVAIAAVLRAVANQVVSAEPEDKELDFCFSDSIAEWCQWSQRQHTRRQILAIAAELEALPE